ncbi:MAG: DUF421 domain-containing protein [bacterium]|nr:DUF421 domain-containing protein [bacterium]
MFLEKINVLSFLIKTTVVFAILLCLTKILGKKQMSQLTPFNYITGITLGSISADIICRPNTDFIQRIIGLIWWCLLAALAGYIGLKSKKFRTIVDGEPVVIIKEGQIRKQGLRLARLNIDGLLMLLRQQSIFSISEVEYAVLEQNGKLSVMKKSLQQQVTKEDMNIAVSAVNHIPLEIITDGKLVRRNLMVLNLTEEWVKEELKRQNISSIEEVFYAEIQSDDHLIIQKN